MMLFFLLIILNHTTLSLEVIEESHTHNSNNTGIYSIQDEINNANPGDIIHINPGIYFENLIRK